MTIMFLTISYVCFPVRHTRLGAMLVYRLVATLLSRCKGFDSQIVASDIPEILFWLSIMCLRWQCIHRYPSVYVAFNCSSHYSS